MDMNENPDQCSDPDTPDFWIQAENRPRSRVLMTKKLQLTKNLNFFSSKTAIYLYLGLLELDPNRITHQDPDPLT
jgi:hypothetical protein